MLATRRWGSILVYPPFDNPRLVGYHHRRAGCVEKGMADSVGHFGEGDRNHFNFDKGSLP